MELHCTVTAIKKAFTNIFVSNCSSKDIFVKLVTDRFLLVQHREWQWKFIYSISRYSQYKKPIISVQTNSDQLQGWGGGGRGGVNILIYSLFKSRMGQR